MQKDLNSKIKGRRGRNDRCGNSILNLGKTGYVKTGTTSVTGTVGEGVIYWAADGSDLYKTPQGPIWGDTVSFTDVESGQLRITIVKTVLGNAENLK